MCCLHKLFFYLNAFSHMNAVIKQKNLHSVLALIMAFIGNVDYIDQLGYILVLCDN